MEPRAYNNVSNKIMAKADDINKMTDLEIVKAILNRNPDITIEYLYKKKYYLFKTIYDRYYTDCKCCKEFIDEIYLLILKPSKKTGRCQLENYNGQHKLDSWLISVCLYYCYAKYKLKKRMQIYEPVHDFSNDNDDDNNAGDRSDALYGYIEIDISSLNRDDVESLLNLMPNTRYRNLIRLLHLEQKTHKETADALGMTMSNYYNKRILAEKQFKDVYRKEERNG